MKLLVLSDSHSALRFMRDCIDKIKPDQVVHLGDHIDDGQAMEQKNSHIRFHLVPGNCDRYRCDPTVPDILCYDIGGVRFYMTHGHRHAVKSGIGHLIAEARKSGAQGVLYGHTHQKECICLDGLWVLNPGSCGYGGGSAAVIEITDQKISACYHVEQAELESL